MLMMLGGMKAPCRGYMDAGDTGIIYFHLHI